MALRRIAPITEIIADGQPPAKKDLFRKHLKDCFHILRLERSDNVSPRRQAGGVSAGMETGGGDQEGRARD